MLDVTDTIAAIAVPPAGAARGIVRISGPQVIEIVSRCFVAADGKSLHDVHSAMIVPGTAMVTLTNRVNCPLPCDAFVWPGTASYTRQPTVELHTLGSPPLLQATLRTLCDNGARLAEPGEFTLRAFLAGRLDLTQAEAVLGVIDSRGTEALQTALQQLAGGLSQPLGALRISLIDLLADLEAGLDFVEEDIEFVNRDEVLRRVDAATSEVQSLIDRLACRSAAGAPPRIVLIGPPNSGKSSLFNALQERYGSNATQPALVSDIAGTTRDYLAARLDLHGIECELIDTAGTEEFILEESIASAAQEKTRDQGRYADLRLQCVDAKSLNFSYSPDGPDALTLVTKCDLQSLPVTSRLATSARTGAGLDALAAELRQRLLELTAEAHSGMVAATSARCDESLRAAHDGLSRLSEMVKQSAGEELFAAELRDVLTNLGRVVGAVYTDDILDQIFSRFCIGK